MIIQSKTIEMVDVSKIVPNPKNPNKHPKEQIERLAKLVDFQGFRQPLIISNRSGFLVAGHGRLEMALFKGIAELPVMYQDFESEAQEYAFVVSDNEIQRWAETDLAMVKIEALDLDIQLDLLGIEDFEIEDIELELETEKEKKTLTLDQRELINLAWSSWCSDIYESVAVLSNSGIFAQSYNRSYLKISFLNALFLDKKITRSSTLGYHPHRMHCSGDGKNGGSIIQLLQLISTDHLKSERIRFALQEKPSIEKLVTVAGVAMAGHKAPLDFPVDYAKDLYNEFAKGGRVLDPCHGWGGRYLGFALSEAVEYLGVDASNLTSDGLKLMHEDLHSYHGKSASFICSPFEDVLIESDYFDFALTSPPYFDRESYIGGIQAHDRYATYDEFIAGFYTKMISSVYSSLKKDSVFCLQVGNQKYDLDKKAVEIAKALGFEHLETRATKMSAVGADEAEEVKEVLIVLRK